MSLWVHLVLEGKCLQEINVSGGGLLPNKKDYQLLELKSSFFWETLWEKQEKRAYKYVTGKRFCKWERLNDLIHQCQKRSVICTQDSYC